MMAYVFVELTPNVETMDSGTLYFGINYFMAR